MEIAQPKKNKLIKIKEALIVEGRYDKVKLASIFDTIIIETNGFGIFKDKEKLDLIRRLAKKQGIIIFTDSDSAGLIIRNFLKTAINDGIMKNAYTPDIYGKEKRKDRKSQEGKLGVEGISKNIIIESLQKSGATIDLIEPIKNKKLITRQDLYDLGFSGKPGSLDKRKKILKQLGLPENLSTKALIDILNKFISYEEFIEISRNL